MTRPCALGVLMASLVIAGCDRRVEPYIPLSEEPPPPTRPVRIPGLPTPSPSRPPEPGPRTMGAETMPASVIRGTLRLAAGARAEPGGVLFVIARTAAHGPPLAVKRLPVQDFPLDFEIGPADLMMPGGAFEGPLQISARIDTDGNPLTRDPQGLSTRAATSATPGTHDLELVLGPAES